MKGKNSIDSGARTSSQIGDAGGGASTSCGAGGLGSESWLCLCDPGHSSYSSSSVKWKSHYLPLQACCTD